MALLIPYPEIFSSVGIRRENQSSIAQSIKSRNSRIRVFSSVRDLEKGSAQTLDLRGKYVDSVGWLHGIFSSQIKQSETAPFPSRKSEDEEEERRNYYVNMGYAIRTLREEFPELFHKELSFDIYRDDIVFKDPYNTFGGIENYKSIFWSLRFYGGILFKTLWVDIVSVWQPSENMIMVRWIVHGIPRIPWESRSRFDGTSEYKLDKNGKIYEHRVHNIALNGPHKFQVLGVEQMIQTIGCPSTPKPTYFEFSSASMKKCAITEISSE
ncbi:uncharacterized protein [Primulina eburnea]|uniref:uncharacterized protein n=1 Tax=Primulina eburnea TaxID=1245227 RepID=UPI003C6C77B6